VAPQSARTVHFCLRYRGRGREQSKQREVEANYTGDGLHKNEAGYLAIDQSRVIASR